MNQTTWAQIDVNINRYASMRSESVSPEEFDAAFAQIQVPADYREFILRFGGAIVGTYPIYGLRFAPTMGTVGRKKTAIELTSLFRERKWPGVENWFVFTIDQSGMPIGFDAEGAVWISDSAFNQIQKLGDDFEDFVLKWCLRTRNVS